MSIIPTRSNRSTAERQCADKHGYIFPTPYQEMIGIDPNPQPVKEAYQACLADNADSQPDETPGSTNAVQQAGISFNTLGALALGALVVYLIVKT
jgi:hypothetical protein